MRTIAMLLGQIFEDSEYWIPYNRLRTAGYQVDVVGHRAGEELVGRNRIDRVWVELPVDEIDASDYDGLVIASSASSGQPADPGLVRFTREIALADKPVAAACFGPSMLIEADVVSGRLVTASQTLEAALVHAGGRWLDRDVVVDGNIITARGVADLNAFMDAFLHELEEGVPTRAEPVYPFEPQYPAH